MTEAVKTNRFIGLLGFVPRTGGNILNAPAFQQIISTLGMEREGTEYQDGTSFFVIEKGTLDHRNNVRVQLELERSKILEKGYNPNIHDPFAAFIYRNNGRIEVIEARTLEPMEFDKYVVPVTFHSSADIFRS